MNFIKLLLFENITFYSKLGEVDFDKALNCYGYGIPSESFENICLDENMRFYQR